jgi:D-alanyl-D-alanine carboxypeptidase (penicillin-binding protein 5/6)
MEQQVNQEARSIRPGPVLNPNFLHQKHLTSPRAENTKIVGKIPHISRLRLNHSKTRRIMFFDIISRLSIFSLLLFYVLFIPGTVFGVPILKDPGKRPHRLSKSVVSPKSALSRISLKILGKHGDFSTVKRQNARIALASAKLSVSKNLSARSAIIIDAVTGQTIFAKNPHTPRQPASTIKVLTGMIALNSLKNNDSVSVSQKASRQPSSKVYLDHGKVYPANDLINAVLVASANDAGVALAEKIAGSEAAFAKLMTLRARLWGAKTTICKTATGLTAKGQQSTAHDLAVIFGHAMKDTKFADRMKQTKVRTTEGKILRNHNKALWRIEGTEGGKTGYTNAARQTYVGKFKRGNDEIIIAVMGSEQMWADVKHLVEYGFRTKQLVARK